MTVIRAENLGKMYRLGEKRQNRFHYDTFRNMLARSAQGAMRRLAGRPAELSQHQEFWALRNINFEIKQGQRLGIIGRNGAGKSTMLKLLSRITDPTEGRITLRGRVASLLEVGTGFHPELTGRENIFLNGAILGMTRDEIKRKFDEIVAFADVEKFLDTPVKHYSSGMYVRLAFAVAAHLEPEILIVDEVLAVGDVQFQKKCMAKMEDIGKSGHTVLFVSHNMAAIEQMCDSILLFDGGKLVRSSDDVPACVQEYRAAYSTEAICRWDNSGNEFDHPAFRPASFWIGDSDGNSVAMPARNDDDLWVHIKGEIGRQDDALQVGYGLYTEDGQLLYWSCSTDAPASDWPKLGVGRHHIKSKLPKRLLNAGGYRLDLFAALYHRQWLIEPGTRVPQITLSIEGGLSDSPYWMNRRPGCLGPVLPWDHAAANSDGT